MIIIIGATGTISKSLKEYLSNLLGRHNFKNPRRTAIMSSVRAHAHTHTSESTNVKVQKAYRK
jgi:hypothetical protein